MSDSLHLIQQRKSS